MSTKLSPGFDLNSVEVFILTAELGGMTQSARHLGMTQSAVSQTISKLEQALGARLFDRTMRPVALTPAGKLLRRDGGELIAAAKLLAREVRDETARPADCITIAMAESLANHLTAPLLKAVGPRALRWQMRSGISLMQQREFLSRSIDLLITGSSQLENLEEVEHFPIMDEAFVIIAPAEYVGPLEPIETLTDLPLVRYSLLSAMGQRIERQLSRMRMQMPNVIEVDSTFQQVSSVAAGVGWSITTPLCLASQLELLPGLRVAPMRRASFRRRIQLVARRGEFGGLPQEIATRSTALLQAGKLAQLIDKEPWIADCVSWGE
ncbi:LysR family transcriptional regulator [Sphingomonas sp. DC1100-1]|jgi:DNA-binding transcriptional LysR family regulator|uniref:LysR family transcriptional regulator n=1 Tax=unclassified Sphingomonas TaxID=196159 RepID=UPI003CE76073